MAEFVVYDKMGGTKTYSCAEEWLYEMDQKEIAEGKKQLTRDIVRQILWNATMNVEEEQGE